MQDRQGGARDTDVLDGPRFVPLTPRMPVSAAERGRFRLTGEVEEVGPVIRIQYSDDGVHWKDVEGVPGEEERSEDEGDRVPPADLQAKSRRRTDKDG